MQPVARLLVHRVEDLVGGVEADEVHQRERAHRQAAAQPHRRVDVLAGGVAVLEHRDGVVEVAEQQRVGDEAGPVADGHVDLAQPLGQRLDVLDDLGLGDDGAHHLDQLHDRRGVEEVHADDLARPAGGDRDLGDRQGRGVGRQDGVRRADPVQLGEDLGLELHALGHGLDDQVGGSARSSSDVAKRIRSKIASRSAASSLPRLDRAVGGLLDVPAAARRAPSSVTSTAVTDRPARAKTSTMPAPMVPRPTTPTSFSSLATVPLLCRAIRGQSLIRAHPTAHWLPVSNQR